MLVARRDPFHPGAHDVTPAPGGAGAPRLARAMSALQIAGTLLAIPVGLGSAYSMYRANFSVEATCQNLRVNIVTMLDKSVDPGTRHMLVRRDVEAFEHACGTVDPDATAAFKALLASDNRATPVAVRVAEPAPKQAERKAEAKIETKIEAKSELKSEPHPVVAAKPPALSPASAPVTEPVRQDAAASDAAWLSAVRHALVTHTADTAPVAAASAPQALVPHSLAREIAQPKDRPKDQPKDQPLELRAPAAALATPVPALPPATTVATTPAPQADDGHPVPPGSIPDAPANTGKVDQPARSRLGSIAAQIPLVGWAFGR